MDYQIKEIDGWEGYKVDTNGVVYGKNGLPRKTSREREDKGGYVIVSLAKGGNKYSWKKVHRLVAEHFLPNPNNLPTVDHIDRNVLNNSISNLRWCSWTEQHFNKEYRKNTNCGITVNSCGTFLARITYQRKTYRKTFDTQEEARNWLQEKRQSLLQFITPQLVQQGVREQPQEVL